MQNKKLSAKTYFYQAQATRFGFEVVRAEIGKNIGPAKILYFVSGQNFNFFQVGLEFLSLHKSGLGQNCCHVSRAGPRPKKSGPCRPLHVQLTSA